MKKTDDSEYFDAKVDKYLRHQMTKEEEQAFILEISTDSEKKERAKVIALMIKAMRQEGLKCDHDIIESIYGTDETEFKNKLKLKSGVISLWPRVVKYSAVACTIGIFLLGVYRYHEFNQTVSLGNSQYSAYISDVSEIGSHRGIENKPIHKRLAELFVNVEKGIDIKSTINELESLYEDCLMDNSSYSEFIDDISWNLAIAYLKNGERKKSIPILEEMLKRNIGYPEISQPVQELIDKIKML